MAPSYEISNQTTKQPKQTGKLKKQASQADTQQSADALLSHTITTWTFNTEIVHQRFLFDRREFPWLIVKP